MLKRYVELVVLVLIGIGCFVIGGVTPNDVNIYEEIGKAVITGAVISYFAFIFRRGNDTSELRQTNERLLRAIDELQAARDSYLESKAS